MLKTIIGDAVQCNAVMCIHCLSLNLFTKTSIVTRPFHIYSCFQKGFQIKASRVRRLFTPSLFFNARKQTRSEREARAGVAGAERRAKRRDLNAEFFFYSPSSPPYPVKSSILRWRPVLSGFYSRVQ